MIIIKNNDYNNELWFYIKCCMLLVYIVYLCSLHISCYAASSVKLISLKYPNLWLIGMNLKWHGSHQSIFFLRTAPTTTASFGSSIIPAEPPTQSFCLGTNLQNHHESSESLKEFAYLALPFTFLFLSPCVCLLLIFFVSRTFYKVTQKHNACMTFFWACDFRFKTAMWVEEAW